MARIVCSTWEGGGNVVIIRALLERLRARGHDVQLQVDFRSPPLLDGDVVLVDHMTSVDGLQAVLDSGRPNAALVHTLWSFVPRLEGTFSPVGYLALLERLDRRLVLSIEELDGSAGTPGVRWVGPAIEPEGPDSGWMPPARSLVVVTMGSHDLGDLPVLQRILDGLATLPVDAVVTCRDGFDRRALRTPSNVQLSGYTRHAALLPHADVFVGHGGHGGIMAALAFGVPMVLVPLDRDQPHNAERVAAVGAGRVLGVDAAPEEIAATIEAVRRGSTERSRAIDLANAVAAYGNAAVDAVEALLR
jgi:hypothetical protein